MNPGILVSVLATAVAVFLVPFIASRIVRDRGGEWVALFFPRREPRWPDGIQEQQDVPWRWRGTEPRVDPPAPRRVVDPDASVDAVEVERLQPRIQVH